nr:Crp/Fnr family transcriptional regulator [uncultured Caproiciproducens sp.]
MLVCLDPRSADYAKGGLIAQAAGPMEEIGIVLDGTIAVTKETPLGERMVLNKISPGGIFGEVAALSDFQRSPATIFALEKSTVMYVRPKKILIPCSKSCPWHTQLTQNLIHLVADRALYLNRKIDYLTIKSMRGKLCTYLYEQYQKSEKCHLILPYNRNELADFLNVSRPSMSRELGRMRDEGILSFQGDTFELLDMEQLKSFVQ